jgi:hypothetical protein
MGTLVVRTLDRIRPGQKGDASTLNGSEALIAENPFENITVPAGVVAIVQAVGDRFVISSFDMG